MYVPGGRTGNRNCPLSLVVTVAGPPISAGEVTRTEAPGSTPPCSSVTVPRRAPVKLCAAAKRGETLAATISTRNRRADRRFDCRLWTGITDAPFGARRSAA